MRTLTVVELGIRELRADLASQVRRAGTGERIVIRVGGRAVAQLGPLDDAAGQVTLADLASRGLVHAPRRSGDWTPPSPITVWQGVRLDRLLAELRGRA
jgi:antitoxin (DNA-binding transcriptional repressor) of toxin-antitoxin stability system